MTSTHVDARERVVETLAIGDDIEGQAGGRVEVRTAEQFVGACRSTF